ncbi:MAG: DUF1302 domain-containing protein [Gammaproteobacteria bacterium]|nr:DUF1302 domain-containing protein [Gammaproteobacteria bacterium]MBU1602711.1 DUF1302 domain-containing protein [Gammaproteobacteria bacterium]MBU2433516.1 DUF1302 domain-containing protein [Gammaproteobacteria bacterium]MBU2451432.1 DUF1302 domain-containing protein [Gammaproteobacteria bacterium]
METKLNTGRRLTLIAAALSASFATQAWGNELPSMGEDYSPWQVDVTYENHTAHREHAGLAKFRNTLQAEIDKKFGDGWKLHSILRGSWDGVYRMNSSEYGKDAGGAINMQSTTPGGYLTTPWGTGPVTYSLVAGLGYPGAAGNAFIDTYGANNPNEGMRVLGDRWHGIDGGVAFGVPVRPCDVDSRGCRDFGGYGDKTLSELEAPEFNNRLDFIRELYVKKTFDLGDGKGLFLKLGKQQVVWGRTDLFRVLDVINPVDYSRNNIYDELSDIRIPMWIAQAEYRMGASETMQDRNFQIVWNVDQFRANNLGQCGTPNVILDAGCFFRGMANLWDNGGTVANFANVAPGTLLATNFGPGQIGIKDVHLPSWSLSNTQLGAKYEGVTADGLSFSLNALTYRSQLPSLHGGKRATNSFTGAYQNAWPYLISFDMEFPRVNLIGGSMDFQLPAAGAAVRFEAAFTDGEEFSNTAREELYSKNNVFRSVIGIDRPTFIPFISETSATLISGQLFYQHIFDHEWKQGSLGPVGMPDWEDNFIGTLLIKAFLNNGTLSPQIIFAHDFQARATAVAPQVEWNVTNDLKVTFGANYKLAEGRTRWNFDDCRACNPFAPYTAPNGDADPFTSYSRGLGGMEPLGRFRAGPIGAAFKENDIFVRVNYKF